MACKPWRNNWEAKLKQVIIVSLVTLLCALEVILPYSKIFRTTQTQKVMVYSMCG